MTIDFVEFPKIARWSRDVVLTEKIDGTNASIHIEQDGTFLTGSRTKWITPEDDNHGFSRWAHANREELTTLGPGTHFGEWWGSGIQRKYGLKEKRFSLFNTHRWGASRPACCHVVPVMYQGPLDHAAIEHAMETLRSSGSVASPGFMNPEGIVIFHVAAQVAFKQTLIKDEQHKGQQL